MNIIDILIIIYLNFKKKVYFPRTLRFIDFLFILVLPMNLVKHRYNDNKFKCLG